MEQALLLNPTDPSHQVKLETYTTRLVGGNPLVSVNITWFCFWLFIFRFSLLSLRSKKKKNEILQNYGLQKGATALVGDLAMEHPEFSWRDNSTQVSISHKKNIFSNLLFTFSLISYTPGTV